MAGEAKYAKTKRPKIEDDSIRYFKTFLTNPKNLDLICMLRAITSSMRLGLPSLNFIHIKQANANLPRNFSQAFVRTELHLEDMANKTSEPVLAPVYHFFLRGQAALQDLLDIEDPKVPADLRIRQALRQLLNFLINKHDPSVLHKYRDKGTKGNTDVVLAVRLAEHLLKPLVPHKTFIIDSYPGLHDVKCCSEEHPSRCEKGDTSFGCPKGWHGRSDILLPENEVSIAVVCDREDGIDVGSDYLDEVYKGENFTKNNKSQIIAQTIAYAFAQLRQESIPECALVPGIGLCSERLIIYLYDCVEDILMTTGPLKLFAMMGTSYLNIRTVIMLWLILNYKLFASHTKFLDTYRRYKAGFHSQLSLADLEAYQKESEQPLRSVVDDTDNDYSKYFEEERWSGKDNYDEARDSLFPKIENFSLALLKENL